MIIKMHYGFTLIETMIAMFMLSITMAAFYSVYRMQTRSLKGQENRLDAQQTARAALDFMVREIRNARYNPTNTNNGASCGDGAPGRPGVIEATGDTFHFSYDTSNDLINGNCAGTGGNVKYSLTGNDVTRTADGNADVLTDGNVADNGLTLEYFNEAGGQLALPLDDQPKRDSIKRVRITVTIVSKNPTDESGGELTAEMITNVNLRNPA